MKLTDNAFLDHNDDLPEFCELWQVNLPYACFGVVVTNNEVVEAPPIGRWMTGKLWPYVCTWVSSKKGHVRLIKRNFPEEA